MERQLEKLDSEIDDLTAEIEAAWNAFMSAANPQQKTQLKEIYEDLKEEKQDLVSQRHDLQLKLPSSGEHSVQTPFAEAALAAVGTSLQKRLSDSWPERHMMS